MKKYFYTWCIVSILFIQSTGYSQFWVYQTSGTTQHLNDVYMLDAANGWICGDAGTLLKTNNGGNNWVPVSVTGNDLNSIVFKDVNTGIAVGDNGIIIRTINGGTDWNVVSSGTTEQFRKVASGAGNIVFAAGDNGLAAVSTDNGATWNLRNSGTTLRFRGSSAAGTNKLWAVGENGLIRYSTDSGVNWTTQVSGITSDDLHDIQFVSEAVGFAGGSSNNFIFTSDGGQTWLPRNSGIFMGLNGIYFKDANFGWAVSIVGTIFFTTNGGTSWTSQPCGSASTLKEAYFLNRGRGWTVGENGTVVMYDNPNLPVELNSFSAAITGNSVRLSWSTASEINNRGFEISRKKSEDINEESFWNLIGFVEGNGNTTIQNQYSFSDNNLAAGKYLYRIKQLDFDGSFEVFNLNSEIAIELPQVFSLEQNYPNPFNPSTKINFSVPAGVNGESSNVVLKVYDAIGNEVTTLVNENKPAGNYEVSFNASNFTSGIYFYTIQAGSFAETKKMMLIK